MEFDKQILKCLILKPRLPFKLKPELRLLLNVEMNYSIYETLGLHTCNFQTN